MLKWDAEKRRLRTLTGTDAIRAQGLMGRCAASRAPYQSVPAFIHVLHVFLFLYPVSELL